MCRSTDIYIYIYCIYIYMPMYIYIYIYIYITGPLGSNPEQKAWPIVERHDDVYSCVGGDTLTEEEWPLGLRYEPPTILG